MDIEQINTERILGKPIRSLDQEYWLEYLNKSDMDQGSKIKCVITVWNAMHAIASLGHQSNPIQQAHTDCGQNPHREEIMRSSTLLDAVG